ncbi:hypothetical protein CPB83DRAFT_197704 [Crepidotus variabilis]|uniref:Uncharacterized protein n=1 Tax=Crepidotus variabilis TaxID=179855 RepID=A0A9P6JRR1_9AGAR|nr:hypothetical protein CPB83DRAFT_197704 [Crepidotus variabilis]
MPELTPYNVNTVLGVYPERLFQVMPEVFEEMLDPDIDMMTLFTYCKAIHDRFEHDERPEGHMGFNSFGEACFEGGIVKTLLQIARDPKNQQDQFPALAAHFALQAFWMLMRTGTTEERRELLKQLYEDGVVELCLNNARSAPCVIHRQGSVNFIRCLSSESFLGEFLSAAETSKVIGDMSEYILQGPQLFIEQFGNARLTWQSFLCFGKFGTSRDKAAKYAPRYYAMSQESAAWTIQGLFVRCPPPNPSFCLKILKHDPTIVDLLFNAAAIKRPPWYAELATDSIICESLAMLFRVPDLTMAGVDVLLPNQDLQEERTRKWAALLDCLRILVSRPNWVGMFHEVLNMLEDERPSDVKRMLQAARSEYYAQSRYDLETYLQVFEYRGSCRICLERLLTTLSYLPECDKVRDEDLLSLLRISNAGFREAPNSLEESFHVEADQMFYLESSFEVFRKPLYSVFTEDDVDSPLQIASEPTMGPTAHARFLTLLAQRGVLKKISETSKVPKSAGSRFSLSTLKKIGTPAVIRSFLKASKQRVIERKAVGTRRFKQGGEMDFARAAYCSAAELARSLIMFDEATQGIYSKELEGIRKEYVACLGNAAEMALGEEIFEPSLFYAVAAVSAATPLPFNGSPDAVDASIREKNERRVARAEAGLQSMP